MFSNRQSEASTANRRTGNLLNPVTGVFAAHCVVPVKHQYLGKRSVDTDSCDRRRTASTVGHLASNASSPRVVFSAGHAPSKCRRTMRPSNAGQPAGDPPAAIWAALVLTRSMCS